ncbi:hypothetical protein POD33_04300 [Streptomyces moderatus]|nr:hypothetical protein POD33_04300 [Streptomyces moderatus]
MTRSRLQLGKNGKENHPRGARTAAGPLHTRRRAATGGARGGTPR